jgi:hypothetical protein
MFMVSKVLCQFYIGQERKREAVCCCFSTLYSSQEVLLNLNFLVSATNSLSARPFFFKFYFLEAPKAIHHPKNDVAKCDYELLYVTQSQ